MDNEKNSQKEYDLKLFDEHIYKKYEKLLFETKPNYHWNDRKYRNEYKFCDIGRYDYEEEGDYQSYSSSTYQSSSISTNSHNHQSSSGFTISYSYSENPLHIKTIEEFYRKYKKDNLPEPPEEFISEEEMEIC